MIVQETDDYAPESLRYILEHWREHEIAAEGGTGSLGGRGAGGGDRLAIAGLLADIERAADALPIEWLPTLKIFRAQHRQQVWANRRKNLKLPIALDDQHSVDEALYRMARYLGWSPT